jgi:hypothetical protein
MNVRELSEKLKNLDPNMEVIIQKDSEGNGYSPLDGVDADTVYIAASSYSGDVYNMNWTAADACMPECAWEAVKSEPRALVLYPVN